MFELKNIHYKGILDIPAMTIDEGKITCLVGLSGGGKTTLLKMLNKMISPESGEIRFEGESLETLDSVLHRRRVLLLDQHPFLFGGTIKDNLIKPFQFHAKQAPTESSLKDVLRMVRLDKALDKNVSTLSGGEAQRLALARILLLDGDVYLLDEPSSALDDQTEADVINTLVDFVKTKQKTLVMVTHSRSIAKAYGERIFTVDQGHIKEETNDG